MTRAPDLVVLNGRLMTFAPDTLTAETAAAEALAIDGNRISAVGTTAEIRALIGPGTKVLDAQGATVLPGFIESHVHLFTAAAELEYLDVMAIRGEVALRDAVHAYAAAHPDDVLVYAISGTYDLLGPGHVINRHDLDRILPDRPFAIFCADHHTMWANTAALARAGILHGAEVETGSEVVMGADGLATGELRENGAFGPVLRLSRFGGREMMGMLTGRSPDPAPSAAERALDRAALARGLAHCARHGITTLHNMDGNIYTLELLEELQAEGQLPCRVDVPFHLKNFDPPERLTEAEAMRARWSGAQLSVSRVKLFMDGVIENRTALMVQPYPGTTTHGEPVFSPEAFARACVEADARGFQICVHAVGDLGVRRTIDAFAAARAANGPRDSRHRIEHIELIHPDDLPRLTDLGIVASLQPGHSPAGGYFPFHDGEEGEPGLLHDVQIPTAYAWREIRARAVRTIFSSDWPVIPVDVLRSVRAAVAPDALPAPWRDQSQTLDEALRAYTVDAAWVEGHEDSKGRLAVGYLADITVLARDITALAPDCLDQAGIRATICDGRITWSAPDA